MSELAKWRWTTLGDECEIVSGSTPKTNEPAFWDGDIPWLTPADLSKWKGRYIDGGSRYITQSGLNSCSARLFPRNTVMMSSRAPIGYTAIANREMCTNQGFKSMLPSQTVDPEWLRYFLEHALPGIKAMASGTTFSEISGKKLGTLPMHLPPLDEQRRIVQSLDDHLSRLDNALAELSHAESQTLVFRRSILNAMLNPNASDSGPGVEPMMIPLGWKTVSLGALVDVLDSRRIPLSAAERKHREGSVPYYGATGQVGTIDKPLFDEPLVLLGEDGVQFFDPYKPKAYKVTGPSWVNNHAHVLRPKAESIEFGYLLHYLNAFDYQGYANGTTRLKLTQGAMNTIPIHLPPLYEQRRIVETIDDNLSRLDSTRKSIASQKLCLASLRRSILNQAFNGELGTN